MSEPQFVQVAFDLPIDRNFTYLLPSGLDPPPVGVRVKAPFASGEKTGFVIDCSAIPPDPRWVLKPLTKILDRESLFGAWTLSTARWMSRQYLCSLGQSLSAMLPSARREKDLSSEENVVVSDHDLTLNEEQKEALRAVFESSSDPLYLWGLTGTGKTEVFLQAARRVLESGRQVLYLVPEIALTWPLVTTLKRRFGDRVAVLHSHLTPAQKLGEWRRIREGKADLVVGARSAVFAPLNSPGLFLIDEEHESGYKSGQAPRYHARQVVFHLARLTGARVVLGSATPSLESFHAMKTGVFRLARLRTRPSGGAEPEVRLIPTGSKGLFSPELIEAIHRTQTDGRQSILFLNRRGFGASFHCRTCGEDLLCRNCSVSMTWHKSRGILLCHFCGWQTKPVASCPFCGSLDVGWAVAGTERVEEEIARLFPDLKAARLDSDTTTDRRFAPHVLESFRRREIDVLVGTQMVAKGLDFPNVKLVGILNADTGLSVPDFRASERVYALIRQVAGRAGRFHPDGLVLVQTQRAASEVLRLASSGRDEEFWEHELETRKELRFPPFVRLARLVVRSAWPDPAREWARTLAEALRSPSPFSEAGGEVLGPSECAISVQAGQHRFQVLMRCSIFPPLHYSLRKVLEQFIPPRGVRVEIDIDPLQLL